MTERRCGGCCAKVIFERSHHIVIQAPASAVFDYVSNPRSWPQWLAASHHIDSADRPLVLGETFREKWMTRREAILDWVVTDCQRPLRWAAQAETEFLGPIVIRYSFETVGDGTRYTRTVINPARRQAPTTEMVEKIDRDAAIALGNIKRQVEERVASMTTMEPVTSPASPSR